MSPREWTETGGRSLWKRQKADKRVTNRAAPNRSVLRGVLLLTAAAALAVTAGIDFRSLHRDDLLIPPDSLSRHGHLSDYFLPLRHSPGDADVYIFEGEEPGGHLLILGGTHPNEPAGYIAAVVLLENTRVSRGKVVVIPQVNRSGFTHNDPFEGNPQRFAIPTGSGKRWFRYGSRSTNPVHQWPDPALHVNPSGQKLAGAEARNLNRSYPGRRKGSLTERVAFAVMQVLDQERIDMAVDLHEAAPEYPVINAIVFHNRSAELAAMTLMELQLAGMDIRLEESPLNLRGLSHREWGDHAGIHAFLFESANASHGRLKGRPSPDLILSGKDKNYVKAAELGRLFVPFDERGIPLKARVARHIAAISALLISWEQLHPESGLTVSGWPDPGAVRTDGIGRFLHPPQ